MARSAAKYHKDKKKKEGKILSQIIRDFQIFISNTIDHEFKSLIVKNPKFPLSNHIRLKPIENGYELIVLDSRGADGPLYGKFIKIIEKVEQEKTEIEKNDQIDFKSEVKLIQDQRITFKFERSEIFETNLIADEHKAPKIALKGS